MFIPHHLTVPQEIYLAAVACYLLFFLLFCRFFMWKRYAEKHYWRRCPQLSEERVHTLAAGRPLPFFSVLVPARNEADVIARTVEHLQSLQYPHDRYEVVVVTDQKEAQAAAEARPRIVAAATAFLQGRLDARLLTEEADSVILGLVAQLALAGWDDISGRYDAPLPGRAFGRLEPPVQRTLVRETAALLGKGGGRVVEMPVLRLLRRRLGQDKAALMPAYALLLSLAIPVVLATGKLKGHPSRRTLERLVSSAARAHQTLTREILLAMSEALAADILVRLEGVSASADLAQRLTEICVEVCPTTQDIMEAKVAESTGRPGPALKHVIVPWDFDGRLGGQCLGHEVPSTKGRALNWALAFLDGRSQWCGFYDAESRPDRRVLLYVAHQQLQGKETQLYQGPVFQVRNFYEMSPFCKIASLYQALAHDWYLPALFRRLPFVGGTNLFMATSLVRRLGGYDHSSLTEDLELGTRAFLDAGVWPEYLPMASSEQTPPTFQGFFRQRLRWATGHLQVMDKIKAAHHYPPQQRKTLLRQLRRKGQLEWIFYQLATLVPPTLMVLWWRGWADPEALSNGARWGLNFLSLTYLAFTFYAFYRYYRHLDHSGKPRAWLGQVGVVSQLLFLPLAAFLFPVPYSSALVLKAVGRGPRNWVKTPRTRE